MNPTEPNPNLTESARKLHWFLENDFRVESWTIGIHQGRWLYGTRIDLDLWATGLGWKKCNLYRAYANLKTSGWAMEETNKFGTFIKFLGPRLNRADTRRGEPEREENCVLPVESCVPTVHSCVLPVEKSVLPVHSLSNKDVISIVSNKSINDGDGGNGKNPNSNADEKRERKLKELPRVYPPAREQTQGDLLKPASTPSNPSLTYEKRDFLAAIPNLRCPHGLKGLLREITLLSNVTVKGVKQLIKYLNFPTTATDGVEWRELELPDNSFWPLVRVEMDAALRLPDFSLSGAGTLKWIQNCMDRAGTEYRKKREETTRTARAQNVEALKARYEKDYLKAKAAYEQKCWEGELNSQDGPLRKRWRERGFNGDFETKGQVYVSQIYPFQKIEEWAQKTGLLQGGEHERLR